MVTAPRVNDKALHEAGFPKRDIPKTKRLLQMDGLRGVAMLFVFLGHFGPLWNELTRPSAFNSFFLQIVDADATFGSSLFMLLSGFFAYGSLMRRSRGFGDFLAGRLLRLYPMYLLMVVIYVAGSLAIPKMSKIPSSPGETALFLIETVLFLPGLPFVSVRPLMDFSWTLSFILFFYFIEAALAYIFRFLALPRFTRLAILISGGLLWAWAGDVYGWWQPRTAIFWIGMALLESVEAMEARRPVWEKRILPFASALIVAGVFMRTFLMLRHPNTGPLSILFTRFVITSITLSSLVFVARFGPVWWKQMLASRQLCQLGASSYSFYLTHGFTIKAFRFGIIPWLGPAANEPIVFWCCHALGLVISILVARAAYCYVENPLSEFSAFPSRALPAESRGEASPA